MCASACSSSAWVRDFAAAIFDVQRVSVLLMCFHSQSASNQVRPTWRCIAKTRDFNDLSVGSHCLCVLFGCVFSQAVCKNHAFWKTAPTSANLATQLPTYALTSESCLREGFEVFVRWVAVLTWLLGSKFICSSQNHSARKIAVEYLQK